MAISELLADASKGLRRRLRRTGDRGSDHASAVTEGDAQVQISGRQAFLPAGREIHPAKRAMTRAETEENRLMLRSGSWR